MPKLHCQCHHCVTTRNVEGGGGGGAEGGICLSYTVSVTTVSPLEMLKGGG